MTPNTILYPLTNAQRVFYYTVSQCPKQQVLNIGVSLTIEVEVDFPVLKACIYEAYDHYESARLRFHQLQDGTVMQYLAKKETRDIAHFDFRHWQYEDAEKEMKSWTEVPFQRFDSPMNELVMIEMPDGFSGVYFKVDHMTMDAQALIGFLSDIIALYSHKKHGYNYQNQARSYLHQLEKDLQYEEGGKAFLRDKAYWDKEIASSEPMFTDILGTGLLDAQRAENNNPNQRAAINGGSLEADICTFHLEPHPSDAILNFCKEYNVPPVCLLMMAMRTYLQKQNKGEPDVSIQSTVSRRATLLEKNSGGTRVHFFPCRTIVQLEDTFLDGLRKIQDSQNSNFRHANYDPIAFMTERAKFYGLLPGQTYEPMSLTYQPLSVRSQDLPQDIRFKSYWYSNGVAAHALYLTVMHRSLDNGMDFSFEYKKGKYTRQELELVYYYVTKILFEGIHNPEKTVGDIIASV